MKRISLQRQINNKHIVRAIRCGHAIFFVQSVIMKLIINFHRGQYMFNTIVDLITLYHYYEYNFYRMGGLAFFLGV